MAIERIIPDTLEWEAFHANHISRYNFAAAVLSEKKVRNLLDIACGVGYGTRQLENIASGNVVGADISEEALSIARTRFSHPKITFLKDDAQHPSVINQYAPFDAIVSFE